MAVFFKLSDLALEAALFRISFNRLSHGRVDFFRKLYLGTLILSSSKLILSLLQLLFKRLIVFIKRRDLLFQRLDRVLVSRGFLLELLRLLKGLISLLDDLLESTSHHGIAAMVLLNRGFLHRDWARTRGRQVASSVHS